MTDYLVPILLLISCSITLRKKENTYDLLLSGAGDGLKLLVSFLQMNLQTTIINCYGF